MKRFSAIAALSLNRVIGCANEIPWHLPDDFKWFKKMTTGKTIVMGRKTFESIGRPLPNRKTFVLSSSFSPPPGVGHLRSLDELLAVESAAEVFICGGAQVYAQALPFCSDLYLTWVQRVCEGDSFFPEFEHLFVEQEMVETRPDFQIIHYTRRP